MQNEAPIENPTLHKTTIPNPNLSIAYPTIIAEDETVHKAIVNSTAMLSPV